MSINIGVVDRIKSVTASYQALITDDRIFVDATTGNVVITMPLASLKPGKVISVFQTDASINTVTVAGTLGSFPLDKSVKLVSNGLTWSVDGVISGAEFVGSIRWSAYSATWLIPLSTSAYSDDSIQAAAGNATITYSGNAIPDATIPGQKIQIRLSSGRAGRYTIRYQAPIGVSAVVNPYLWAITSDEGSSSQPQHAQLYLAGGPMMSIYVPVVNEMTLPNFLNKTLRFRLKGNSHADIGTVNSGMEISVYRYPLPSQMIRAI